MTTVLWTIELLTMVTHVETVLYTKKLQAQRK